MMRAWGICLALSGLLVLACGTKKKQEEGDEPIRLPEKSGELDRCEKERVRLEEESARHDLLFKRMVLRAERIREEYPGIAREDLDLVIAFAPPQSEASQAARRLLEGIPVETVLPELPGKKSDPESMPDQAQLTGEWLEWYLAGEIDKVIEAAKHSANEVVRVHLVQFDLLYDRAIEIAATPAQLDMAIDLLERALKMDERISGGSGVYHDKLTQLLAKCYFLEGIDAQKLRHYDKAYQRYQQARGLDYEKANGRLDELAKIARKLYEEAYVIKSSKPDLALEKLDTALHMLPSDHRDSQRAKKLWRVITGELYSSGTAPREEPPGKTGEATPVAPSWKNTPVMELVKKGNMLVKENKAGEARAIFESALELDPDNCDALVGLGVCHARVGDGSKAADWYRVFVKKCPKDKRAGYARQTLRQFEEKAGEDNR